MKIVKRILCIAISVMILLLLPACSTEMTAGTSEEVVLKFAVGTSQDVDIRTRKLLELVERKTGYKCQTIVVTGDELDSTKKIRVSIMSGDEYDMIYSNTDTCYNYAQTGIIKPLDDLIETTGYDAGRIYGSFLSGINGKIYMLPELRDVHVTYYNKKIFDDAKVPYPEGNWTWQDYVNIAAKLTDKSKGIYGSYFIEWPVYFTFSAHQKKTPFYKTDGTSNFDDPAWKESFKFMADLGNVYKVQPDYLTYKTEKLPYDMFFQGNVGMWPAGTWIMTMVSDLEKYPRAWKIGITTLPQVNRGENVTLSMTGGYSIISTTKHEKEAFEAIKAIAENAYTVCTDFPCRVDLGEGEIDKVAEKIASLLTFDGISSSDIKNAILNDEMELVPENEMGPGAFMIAYTLIPKMGELYCTGQLSLDETMEELKAQADEVIKEDREENVSD